MLSGGLPLHHDEAEDDSHSTQELQPRGTYAVYACAFFECEHELGRSIRTGASSLCDAPGRELNTSFIIIQLFTKSTPTAAHIDGATRSTAACRPAAPIAAAASIARVPRMGAARPRRGPPLARASPRTRCVPPAAAVYQRLLRPEERTLTGTRSGSPRRRPPSPRSTRRSCRTCTR